MNDIVNRWESFKREQPGIALALSVLPVTGQLAAATEYYGAMERGDLRGGVEAALQFIPGLGILKKGRAIFKAGEGAMAAARASVINGTSSASIYSAEKAAGLATRNMGTGVATAGGLSEIAANYGNVKDYMAATAPDAPADPNIK